MQSLKRTAFFEIHKRLGAKMVEFAGYEMPVQYTGILEEHRRVRNSVGVFDVSHMGEVEVRGRDALAFIQSVTINDASRLNEGRVQYSAMCYDDGGIVDDLLVYNLGGHYMLVVNASNAAKDLAWLRAHLRGDVTLADVSDATALLAVQGPRSLDTLCRITDVDLATIPYYHAVRGRVAGVPMIISRTGYTGELGFELYFDSAASTAEAIWQAVMDAGRPFSIGPAGLGARDTLRLEMGFCLYGHDIDASTNPIEAGLGWITKIDKGPFLGREPIRAMKAQGPARKLVGFALEDKAFPRQGYALRKDARDVGTVTSGTFSPTLEKGIGMGYVRAESARPGTGLAVNVRGRDIPAVVVPLPFVTKK